jgi:hypothetical protein
MAFLFKGHTIAPRMALLVLVVGPNTWPEIVHPDRTGETLCGPGSGLHSTGRGSRP